MSKHYRSAVETVIRAEPGSASYSLDPQQERCSCFAVALPNRWILPSELLGGSLFSVPYTSFRHLCQLGFPFSEWVVMLLCSPGNLEMGEVGRRASTVAGWVSLVDESRERGFYGLLFFKHGWTLFVFYNHVQISHQIIGDFSELPCKFHVLTCSSRSSDPGYSVIMILLGRTLLCDFIISVCMPICSKSGWEAPLRLMSIGIWGLSKLSSLLPCVWALFSK